MTKSRKSEIEQLKEQVAQLTRLQMLQTMTQMQGQNFQPEMFAQLMQGFSSAAPVAEQVKARNTTSRKAKAEPGHYIGEDMDWNKISATCPKCGEFGTVAKMFGTKKQAGYIRRQSWCRQCRSAQSNFANRGSK